MSFQYLLILLSSIAIPYNRAISTGPNPTGCDQVRNGTEGIISSNNVTWNETCTWRFNVDKTTHLYLMFTKFSLYPGDVLQVYSGSTKDQLIGNFTGSMDQFVVVSFSPNSTIVLKTSATPDNNTRHVNLSYSTKECSLSFHQPGHLITSPYYLPQPKGHDGENIVCNYGIALGAVSKLLTLTITKLYLEEGVVSVFDGNSTNSSALLDKYTANNASLVSDTFSSGTSLLLEIQFSATPKKMQIVSAIYSLVSSECSGKLKAPVQVSSPGYPKPYKSGLDCQWIIYTPTGTSATLLGTMSSLSLGDEFDYLAVNDGGSRTSQSVMMFKKGDKASLVASSGRNLWLRFFSDESLNGKGFSLKFTLQKDGGRFYGTSGKIALGSEGPSLSLSATESHTQYFWIMVPADKQVLLEITKANLKPTATVTCYGGNSAKDPQVAYFRSDLLFYEAFSDSNEMFVVAKGFSGTQTFEAAYRTVKKGSYLNSFGSSGGIEFSSSGLSRGKALWLVHPSQTNKSDSLMLFINSLNLGDNETLEVHEGLSDQSIRMALFQGPMTYQSALPSIRIRAEKGLRLAYHKAAKSSDMSASYSLVKATYSSGQGCPPVKGNSITSPGYPYKYPLNSHCQWNLAIPKGRSLHLAFMDLQLLSTHYLVINSYFNGTRSYQLVLNGTQKPDDTIIAGDRIEFEFTATPFKSGTNVGRGFNLTYDFIDCGAMVDLKANSSTANVSTPKYPAPLTRETHCVWVVAAPPVGKENGSVNIITFQYHLPSIKKDSQFSAYINDGGRSLDSILPPSPKAQSKNMFSASNKMIVHYDFHPRSNKSQGPAFKIDFNIQGCDRKHQCKNGKCLQPDWICDGIDQCGDMTDEKDCAKASDKYIGVPTWGFVLAILAALVVGGVVVVVVPYIYRRRKYPNYQALRDAMVPVDT